MSIRFSHNLRATSSGTSLVFKNLAHPILIDSATACGKLCKLKTFTRFLHYFASFAGLKQINVSKQNMQRKENALRANCVQYCSATLQLDHTTNSQPSEICKPKVEISLQVRSTIKQNLPRLTDGCTIHLVIDSK
jgi:hypothetical protein